MQFRRLVIEFIALVIIGFVIVVAGSVIAGVDMAIYPAWMWISSLVVIMFLAAIIAVLLVRWQDSLYDEGTPEEERYYQELRYDTPEEERYYRDLRK